MEDLKPLNEDSGKLFEAYGMTEEEFWCLPYEELWKLMNGRPTGMTERGQLKIIRTEDGKQVGVVTPPLTPFPRQARLPVAFPLRGAGSGCASQDTPTLSDKEMAVLKEQGVIYKELNNDGERNRSFIQLEKETGHLMVAKSDDVGKYFPTSIFTVELTREERNQLREGQTVVVTDGEQKYEIKVDLTRRAGFSLKNVTQLP